MKLKYLIKPKKFFLNFTKQDIYSLSFSLLFFIVLTSLVLTGQLRVLDDYWLTAIRNTLPSWFLYIAKAFYFIGEAEVAVFIVLFSLIFLVWKKRWLEAQVMALSCLFVLILIDKILKPWFAISRPENHLVETAFGYSYPSGHGTGNLLLYLLLCYFFAQSFPQYKRLVFFITILFMILMGISSVYLRVHWVTDFFAAYALGYILFVLSVVLHRSSIR